MMKVVYIAHAVGDENGKASGGNAGDQTGKEVRIQPWYLNSKGWIVLRPKDLEVAEKIAYDAKAACDNDNIGYDQSERSSLYKVASKVGFDCFKVETPCECDCSALVKVCLTYAGINVKSFSTATEMKTIMDTGKFIKLTDPKYTESCDYLMVGDILVTKVKGHTAIVLNNGSKAEIPQETDDPMNPPEIKTYVLVKGGSIRLRKGPGIIYRTEAIVHRGDKLPFLGSDEETGWYKVLFKGFECFITCKPKYTELVKE